MNININVNGFSYVINIDVHLITYMEIMCKQVRFKYKIKYKLIEYCQKHNCTLNNPRTGELNNTTHILVHFFWGEIALTVTRSVTLVAMTSSYLALEEQILRI